MKMFAMLNVRSMRIVLQIMLGRSICPVIAGYRYHSQEESRNNPAGAGQYQKVRPGDEMIQGAGEGKPQPRYQHVDQREALTKFCNVVGAHSCCRHR